MDVKKRIKTEIIEKDPLTPKQRRFVQELVLGETVISAQQCAINAGYEESSARQKAYTLQNPKCYPAVASEIQKFRDEVNTRYAANKGNHLRQLARLRDNAVEKGQFGPAIVAEHRIGQTNKVTYIDLCAEKTIDEKIIKALRKKINIASEVMGEKAKKWLI